jgi:L-amino acid N-acyltransferase YncA
MEYSVNRQKVSVEMESCVTASKASVCVHSIEITIRPATIADLDPIARIWCEGFESSFGKEPPTYDSTLLFFSSHLQLSHPWGYWMAEANGVVVGWQSLLPSRPSPISKWACSSTYIARDNHAKGVGRALVTFASRHAESSGLSHIEALIRIQNHAAVRIADSLGWKKVGLVPQDPEISDLALYIYPVPTR